jgi:hypothetical protein
MMYEDEDEELVAMQADMQWVSCSAETL